MKKLLGMVFFLTVLAGMAGCGQKNTVNTTEQTDTETEKTLEEHFFSAEQDEQNYNVMEEYSEDDEYPELAAFLTEYYQIPEEECKETRYYYTEKTRITAVTRIEREHEITAAEFEALLSERDEALRGLQALVCLSPASRPRCRCP